MRKRLTKTIWYGSDVDSNGNPILPSTHGGLDGLNYGELYLHLSNGKASLWTLSSDGKIVEITGGGSEVDMSSYLLKSIWDKVFEIRTDSQGTEYIFGKLPMVTQYGITMYSGDGVDIPSLASGLPFDGRTIWYNPDTQQIEVIGGTGGGSGEGVSNFWDLSGIPSWITNTKPKYTYSEIEGTPDLTQYALVSQIPSLSGYATESWVLQKNYATKATTLSGYGITDAYTKTNVDDLLLAYVTLAGTQTITGEKNFTGGLKVNGSPIVYDATNKYWKLEGDLLVTGGVTMYGNEGTYTPSTIMDAIAVDGTTISKSGGVLKVIGGTGGGSGEGVSNFWDLSGIPSWITNSKPKYTYIEIEGTPDLTKYALASQIPSLSGYATESWVLQKNYATKATTLSGYGITDAYTKTNVDELLKTYVTLGGTQTITGEKNFTGGLKVNGSPIYYDTEKKYWKFEGDLLVTGGVTMYGNEGTYTPSTIMDAIAVDGTTISKSGGVLKVIGGTGGGVADSVAWANITGKPTWIGSSKPTYSYSEITGAISTTELQNYLTQNSYLNVTSGDNRYLKLSGGAINGTSNSPFTVNTSSQAIELQLKSNSNIKAYIGWNTTDGVFLQEGENTAYIGVQTNKNPYYYNGTRYTLWHAGNDGSGSGLDADLLDGQEETTFAKWKSGIATSGEHRHIGYAYGANGWITSGAAMSFGASENYFMQIQGGGNKNKDVFLYARYIYEGIYSDWKTIAFTDSNVASATYSLNTSKLYSTDIIYSYGSANPYYGYLTLNNTYGEWDFKVSPNTPEYIHVYSSDKLRTARTIWGQSFDGTGNVNGNMTGVGIVNSFLNIKQDNSSVSHLFLTNPTSNVDYGHIYVSNYDNSRKDRPLVLQNGYGNVGIGTTSPSYTLDVSGTCRASISVTSNMFFTNGEYGIWKGSSFTGGLSANDLAYYAEKNVFYGNVGIGTTSPSSLLHVNGDSRISDIHFRAAYMNLNRDGATSAIYDSTKTALEIEATQGVSILRTYNVTRQASIVLHTNGNIGIGTLSPSTKLHVAGNFRTNDVWIGSDTGTYIEGTQTGGLRIQYANSENKYTQIQLKDLTVTINNNLLCSGGITMYSDQRKKTILNHVELSLKQIVEAPLIEHYYNGDEKKTTHVGSIAQYWANMNDWFCKLDSEGYYTMEIQNAALASAISIARELDRYETKTDKAIKKLKKRICELEEEVERLKSA